MKSILSQLHHVPLCVKYRPSVLPNSTMRYSIGSQYDGAPFVGVSQPRKYILPTFPW
ncbi:hypothetical protein ASPTUDRAFT_668900 [Aspergillus tubingensis CBS 134.48]|uniref:Uncharacterized protein n=1 Tax=Aspergillus tubingensis (strain CBS 134.48) TaxID=767770 RepID=A0A1L9N5G9_ASPTC|nr:hypothetical protein ASPTUDRAFT_668900 [Aspergillus tubingensis CBS 134.48]